ncbi:MAG: protein kinase [Gemmatimonadales bacterium]
MPVTKACPSCNTPLPEEAAFCFMCGAATPHSGIDRTTGEIRTLSTDRMPSRDLARLDTVLGAHYELGKLIGRGGFAEVFLLHDRRLKRELAVKVLRSELSVSDQLIARFRREAETVAALRNPHIVPIYDIGEAEGMIYLIMPFIRGESLKALLVREGPRPPREAVRILVEAADALEAAHEAGVVHRDVKPENIMLEGRARRVQLMDFGISKALDSSEGSGLTSTGILVGTPHFMSPEQAAGEPNLDHRSDQYALAVVGYQMITGELPFDGESTRAILFQQMVGIPKSLRDLVPDVPASLAFAIEKALSKEPRDRYSSMEEFAQALTGSEHWPPIFNTADRLAKTDELPTPAEGAKKPTPPAGTPAPAEPAPKATKRRPAWLPAAAGIGVVAVAALAYALSGPPTSVPAATDSTAVADSGVAVAAASPVITDTAGSTIVGTPAPPPAAPTATTSAPTPRSTRPERPVPPPPPPTPATPRSCGAAVREANWTSAASLCLSEAEGGNAAAMRQLAVLYKDGNGVEASDSAAKSWYRRAATGGDATAAYQLGLLLAASPGNDAREREATDLLRQAADAGIEAAWPVLAERYEQGLGSPRRDQEAAFWYRKAAEQGNRASQYNLGVMYARGRGVPKNETEAFSWFTRAAEQGHTAAQYELGMAYVRGRGVQKSDSLGFVWLDRAAQQGHPEAKKEADKRRP